MLGLRWARLFLVLWVVGWVDCTSGGSQVRPEIDLNQADAEIVLNAQTVLRRYLIRSLTIIRESTIKFGEFSSVVAAIIQGLQTRDINPLRSFKKGDFTHNNQSDISHLAEFIYNLQGGEFALSEWNSLLQSIPDITALVPSLPIAELTRPNLQKAEKYTEPHVLAGIQKNRIKLNKQLLADVLYNYRFGDYSAELEMVLDSFNQALEKGRVDFDDFPTDPAVGEQPHEIVSEIIRYVIQKQPPDSELALQAAYLLSGLSNTGNVIRQLERGDLAGLFDLMLPDEYPVDVILAKDELARGIRTNRVGVDITEVAESLAGYSPVEKLLGLIAKLSFLLSKESSLFKKVQAVYPHVKLKYLSSRGKFFRPQTPSDVAFLLRSFLTVPNQLNPLLVNEICRLFTLPGFNWREVLGGFDYSLYGKPRPLIIDMLRELLKGLNNPPDSVLITFNYFLRINDQVSCLPFKPNDAKRTTVGLFPHDEETPPTMIPNDKTTNPVVKRCSDGSPVALVDPESITGIISASHHRDFITHLIRYNPMPAEEYSNKTRVDVFKTVLGNLKNVYEDDVSFVIEKALERTLLNEKAHLPPEYIHLCASNVTKMKGEPPSQKVEDLRLKAVINLLKDVITTGKGELRSSGACASSLEQKTSTTNHPVSPTVGRVSKQAPHQISAEPSTKPPTVWPSSRLPIGLPPKVVVSSTSAPSGVGTMKHSNVPPPPPSTPFKPISDSAKITSTLPAHETTITEEAPSPPSS